MTATTKTGDPLDRGTLDTLLRRRLFYTPAFEIYGGVSGLYDYGPPGCSLQANIIAAWRHHFVSKEAMLEVDCTTLTPYAVLKTSGHVDKFADWMCKDPKTGEIFRADHTIKEILEARLKGDKQARGAKIVEEEGADKKNRKGKLTGVRAIKLDDKVAQEYQEILAKIDGYSGEELGKLIVDHGITSPTTGNPLEPPVSFNLMFPTSFGLAGHPGFLRPETAQGQVLSFNKLYEFNNHRMPFASASIGKSFRNEISPRSGLLRVREFLMAEIEHFVDPLDKRHARFPEVADKVSLKFLPRAIQAEGKTTTVEKTIGEAVEEGMVDNETLGYFLARIHLFLKELGVDQEKVRFRQHMPNEMAHYATDCWDVELFTSYGWIECVGCADRSAYDLTAHSDNTGGRLVVREPLKSPKVWNEWDMDVDKKWLGPKFRKDAKKIEDAVARISQEDREKLATLQEAGGKVFVEVEGLGSVELEKVTIAKNKKSVHVREYIPGIIEPSFGIGRIFYCLIEHIYWSRPGDEARGVLSFPPNLAPHTVTIVPLSSDPCFASTVTALFAKFLRAGFRTSIDDSSASIGKRYARNDELGTPFGATVDFQSLKDGTITLRERDGMKQIRGTHNEVIEIVRGILDDDSTFDDALAKFGEFQGQEFDE